MRRGEANGAALKKKKVLISRTGNEGMGSRREGLRERTVLKSQERTREKGVKTKENNRDRNKKPKIGSTR